MAAKPLIFCLWDVLTANRATLQVFILSREAVASRTTCWAGSCLHPPRKQNLLHTDLRLLKLHFLTLTVDVMGVCCCVDGTVGWRSWRYRGERDLWRLPQRYPTLPIWRGSRSDANGACDEKRIWQQDKTNRWKNQSNKLTPQTLVILVCCGKDVLYKTNCLFLLKDTVKVTANLSVLIAPLLHLPPPSPLLNHPFSPFFYYLRGWLTGPESLFVCHDMWSSWMTECYVFLSLSLRLSPDGTPLTSSSLVFQCSIMTSY